MRKKAMLPHPMLTLLLPHRQLPSQKKVEEN
jgi:hypothetical protein